MAIPGCVLINAYPIPVGTAVVALRITMPLRCPISSCYNKKKAFISRSQTISSLERAIASSSSWRLTSGHAKPKCQGKGR